MNDSRRRRRTDRLFGQIAVELGILTPEKLEEALQVQASAEVPAPLGMVLMDLRLVTREDLQRILDAQRRIVERHQDRAKDQKEDHLFGKVAIKLGFLSQDQLNECLDLQKKEGTASGLRLGDLMARRGLIGPEQVRQVMEIQAGLAVPCPSCTTVHNVVMFMPGTTFPCRKCKGEISVPTR